MSCSCRIEQGTASDGYGISGEPNRVCTWPQRPHQQIQSLDLSPACKNTTSNVTDTTRQLHRSVRMNSTAVRQVAYLKKLSTGRYSRACSPNVIMILNFWPSCPSRGFVILSKKRVSLFLERPESSKVMMSGKDFASSRTSLPKTTSSSNQVNSHLLSFCCRQSAMVDFIFSRERAPHLLNLSTVW